MSLMSFPSLSGITSARGSREKRLKRLKQICQSLYLTDVKEIMTYEDSDPNCYPAFSILRREKIFIFVKDHPLLKEIDEYGYDIYKNETKYKIEFEYKQRINFPSDRRGENEHDTIPFPEDKFFVYIYLKVMENNIDIDPRSNDFLFVT